MKQEINPAYVSFEQAKWLAPYKQFNNLESVYVLTDPSRVYSREFIREGLFYSAPEQWQVVEWLRIKHGIWVWVRPYKDHAADNNDPIQHQMNVYKRGVTVSKEFNSHEEAYSAAFDYIKDNNLI